MPSAINFCLFFSIIIILVLHVRLLKPLRAELPREINPIRPREERVVITVCRKESIKEAHRTSETAKGADRGERQIRIRARARANRLHRAITSALRIH